MRYNVTRPKRWSLVIPVNLFRKIWTIAENEGLTIHATIIMLLEKMTEGEE